MRTNKAGFSRFVLFSLVWLLAIISLSGCETDDEISDWSGSWGTGYDFGVGVAVNGSGDVFITGHTSGGLDGFQNRGGMDLFLSKHNASGDSLWNRYLASDHNDRGTDLVADQNGDILGVGYTYGSLGGSHQGNGDLLWFKYNADGYPQWIKQLGGESRDQGIAVALDGSGDILIAGRLHGDLAGAAHYGGADAFIMKCDPDGNKKWLATIGSSENEQAVDIVADGSGDILIVGWTTGAVEDENDNEGDADVFIAKYDSSGDQKWIKQFGTGAYNDFGLNLTVDQSGDIFVAGYTYGDLDGTGDNIHRGGSDAFLAKYDSSGDQKWIKQFGTAYNEEAKSIIVDASGDILVAGQTSGSLKENANQGGYDIFLIKMEDSSADITSDISADSGVKWISQTGSSADDFFSSLAVNASGDIFVTGHTYGDLDGAANKGFSDIFLLKYDSSGDKL